MNTLYIDIICLLWRTMLHVLGIVFVLFYYVHLKFLYIHRHLTDDLLDLQVANGFIVGNDHKKHFLALILNVL